MSMSRENGEYGYQGVQDGYAAKLAIIGGGIMGRGIALAAARSGLQTTIIEASEVDKKHSRSELIEFIDRQIARWTMTEAEKGECLARIKWGVGIELISDENYIIEAIPEDYAKKKELFKRLETVRIPKETILITNSSTLSVTEIASVTKCPERVIGMHFLNPVEKARIVELVRGLKTSSDTFNKAALLAEMLDRVAIEVYESPGYVTTRVVLPMINEAIHVLVDAVATAEDIDTAIRLGYDFRKGPLEMADEIGLDMVISWLDTLHHDLNDSKYKPHQLLRTLVAEGHLGHKTSRGFFQYDDDGVRLPGSGINVSAYKEKQ